MCFWSHICKFLGLIVSRSGIEIDPAKMKAIHDMPEHRTEREVPSFISGILGGFIAQLTLTYEPFVQTSLRRYLCCLE